jgi:DHA2 family multidrug resistance protein-like MFS transporter
MQGTARLTGQTVGAVTMSLLFTLAAGDAPRIGLGIAASLTLIAGLVSTVQFATAASDLPDGLAAPPAS